MKRMYLAALAGALTISTLALAVDVASAGPRYGVYRGGVNRIGVNRVGYGRYGYGRLGYGGAGLAYRGGWNGYYRPGLRIAAGAALASTAYYGAGYYGGGAYAGDAYYGDGYYGGAQYAGDAYGNGGYYGNRGYDAFASTDYGTNGGDTYILHGNYISEADAVGYCAKRFRSYDLDSRTFLASSGERVSCPQQ